MENLDLFTIRLKKFLSEVEKEVRTVKIYYKKAKFTCYDSNVFCYEVKHDNTIFEFSFACDDTLLSKMTVKELLELKRISYYSFRIFDEDINLIYGSNCTQ